MLVVGDGEAVRARAVADGDEVEKRDVRRCHGRLEGGGAGARDRSGRQPRVHVGVVRVVQRESVAGQRARPETPAAERVDGRRVALEGHPDSQAVVVDGRDERALRRDGRLLLDEGGEGDGLEGRPPEREGALLEAGGELAPEGGDEGRDDPTRPLRPGEDVRVGAEEPLEARRPGRYPFEEPGLGEQGVELGLRREPLPRHEAEDLVGRQALGNRHPVGDDLSLDQGPEDLLGRPRPFETVLARLQALPAEEEPAARRTRGAGS